MLATIFDLLVLPRADLNGEGEWSQHIPPREGGPQAQSCIACHSHALRQWCRSHGDECGSLIRPRLAIPRPILSATRCHCSRLGAVQRVAEEMTAELHTKRDALASLACTKAEPQTRTLLAKSVDFGLLTATPQGSGADCTVTFDMTEVEGVDDDLVVRMFGWKGTAASIREFSRRMPRTMKWGMQADELVGNIDGDFDGVTSELSIGDLTAISLYIAALERPVSKLELLEHGVIELTEKEIAGHSGR